MKNVTVIIPSLAEVTKPYLKLTVESLRATTDWTIIVVTNGSKHKPDLSDIKGISNHIHTSDQGQCVATNIGAQLALTDYIMVSNDDMYYAPGWNKSLEHKEDWPLVFSPNLVEPTDNPGSAPPFLKFNGGLDLKHFNKESVDEHIRSILPPVLLADMTSGRETGFNLPFFIRRDVWNTIGGYDEAYDPWGSNSDTDLQTMVNLAGITPLRLKDVLVYHFGGKSGTFDGTHQEFYQNNWEWFDQKWGFNRDGIGSDVWYNKRMLPEDPAHNKFKPVWRGKYAQHNTEQL